MVKLETPDGRAVVLVGGFEDPLDEDDEHLKEARVLCAIRGDEDGGLFEALREMIYPPPPAAIVRLSIGGRLIFERGLVTMLKTSFGQAARHTMKIGITIKKLEGNPA